ncbi:MAG: AraC family transcriptional regulator, partial [Mucilaginibacter polytrichastri]|nr:AraC family transcriptional regulator [Mucilaginibacter polytrichastri]
QFRYLGVRFLPGMFTRLSGVAASELSQTVALMSDVLPELSKRLAAGLNSDTDLPGITALFNDYFLRQAERPPWPADPRFDEAMHRLMGSRAETALEKGLQTGLSARQLRRLFHFYVGDSPKVFSNVVRFQRLLRMQSANATAFAEKAWLDAGYYDQAHFIKEFRRFGGITPGSIG